MFWDNAVCYFEEDLGGPMIHWCRNVKCLDLQKELDKLAEVIKEVERLVIPVE